MTASPSTVDPILASVLQRRVDAIAEEMATMLVRSSRSSIFNEIGDLVTVLFDERGRTWRRPGSPLSGPAVIELGV
ncbi:hydantoinase B/oxoprolinase family protein [Pseudonocardia asaccharolytica]|nr:hydantoinase B/oxoprolinase family protein [Pseudonocardia asaccharolytica]